MLCIYRICRNIYNPKDSTGSSQTAGRWHNPGQRVLYFSSSIALSVLELRANAVSFTSIRDEFHYTFLEIKNDLISIEEVPESLYIKNWILNRKLTQQYGDEWFKSSRTLLLKVKSAVLPIDSNFILNTNHPDFSLLKFPKPLKIPLDPRVK